MNFIKEKREGLGFTQVDLAEKSGLSLRTIQRLERSDNAPKGNTLTALCKVFDITPAVFIAQYVPIEEDRESDLLSIKLINLSALAFFGIPFGNVLLPFMLWKKKRASAVVDENGRKILNLQIIFTILYVFLFCISPFINISFFSSFPFTLVVLFITIVVNLSIIFGTAILIQRNRMDVLDLPIRLL